jgi:prophage regulatory protein
MPLTTEVTSLSPIHALPALADRLIRLSQVMDIVGLGKTMIYKLMKVGAFPLPRKIGDNASRWSEQEIYRWVENQTSRLVH